MYQTNLMACVETHVKFTKRSGFHGGRCSSQIHLFCLTPWTQYARHGHHAVTSGRSVWRDGAQLRPTDRATKEAPDMSRVLTSCLQTPATAIQLLVPQWDTNLNSSGE